MGLTDRARDRNGERTSNETTTLSTPTGGEKRDGSTNRDDVRKPSDRRKSQSMGESDYTSQEERRWKAVISGSAVNGRQFAKPYMDTNKSEKSQNKFFYNFL